MTAPGTLLAGAKMHSGLVGGGSTPQTVTPLTMTLEGEGQPIQVDFTGRVAHTTPGQCVVLQIAVNGVAVRRTEVPEYTANLWMDADLDFTIEADVATPGAELVVSLLVSTPAGTAYVGADAVGFSEMEARAA